MEENTIPAPEPVSLPLRKKPILSIISTVLGGVSLLPFLGIASLPGLIMGIVGYVRERHVTGIVGTLLSVAGIATSPTVWGLFGALWLGGYCMIADCSARITEVMENPAVQKEIKNFVQQGASASAVVDYPNEWERKEFDEKSQELPPSIHIGTTLFSEKYAAIPGQKAVMLHIMVQKNKAETTDAFITRFIEEKLKVTNPTLQVTPMEPVTIKNEYDPNNNIAQMRLFSGGRLNNLEAVAYIDGGAHILLVILSAPTRADLEAAWPLYSDILLNKVAFSVKEPAPATDAPGT
jgi:hypothetical protein